MGGGPSVYMCIGWYNDSGNECGISRHRAVQLVSLVARCHSHKLLGHCHSKERTLVHKIQMQLCHDSRHWQWGGSGGSGMYQFCDFVHQGRVVNHHHRVR